MYEATCPECSEVIDSDLSMEDAEAMVQDHIRQNHAKP